MKSRKIILGTRGSKLALFQTNLVLKKLHRLYPNLSFDLKKIVTKGEKHEIYFKIYFKILYNQLISKKIFIKLYMRKYVK